MYHRIKSSRPTASERRLMGVESSIPVQGRIDVKNLVTMVEFFREKGIQPRSMSEVLSFSIECLVDILKVNENISNEMSIGECWAYLDNNKLIQPSLRKRSIEKIANAIALENIRNEGYDIDSMSEEERKSLGINTIYNTLHRIGSVSQAPKHKMGVDDIIDEEKRENIRRQQEIVQASLREQERTGNFHILDLELPLSKAQMKFTDKEKERLIKETKERFTQSKQKLNNTLDKVQEVVVKENMNDSEFEKTMERIEKSDKERMEALDKELSMMMNKKIV